MLNNSTKPRQTNKKETMYSDYLKKKESEKFKMIENIIPRELRIKLANTLRNNNIK